MTLKELPKSIWDKLTEQSVTILILIAAVYYLTQFHVAQSEKQEKYMLEDRTKMIETISSNNEVIRQNSQVIQACTEVLKESKSKK